ncbi:MAG: hypothetical protein K0Q72_4332 [Armatimonadetes bacterium]|jgi:serine/threonine protein phosphatase PrpC|nr:hypothetical protein [Armatimonadota bacterium]
MLRADVVLAWKTQAGHRHQVEGLENEDAVFVSHDHPLLDAVLMVADGMGGHPLPRQASTAAIEAARTTLFEPERLETEFDVAQSLADAVAGAQTAVRKLGDGRGAKQPGTTLSIAAVMEGQLFVAHVGDGSVYLMREGQVRNVAGGEERRLGNRPAQYLGQDTPLEPELRRLKVVAGDRLLLCTDGLTRYFQEAGPEALERVLGRQGVQIQSIASQLTAHSRPDDYDDDTTVALAEVTSVVPVPDRQMKPAAGGTRPKQGVPAVNDAGGTGSRRGSAMLQLLAAGVAGAALLGLGFAGGYLMGRGGPAPAGPGAAVPVEPAGPEPATPETLQRLPAGNLVLSDPLSGRIFSLVTRGGGAGSEPVDLQSFRVGTDGRLAAGGRFRLDPVRGELTDAQGRQYPVAWDEHRTALHVVRGGTLSVATRPAGAVVFVDGKRIGPAPQKLTVAAGKRRVRVEARTWTSESEIEVLGDRSTSVTLGPQ